MRVLGLSVPNQVNVKNQQWLTFFVDSFISRCHVITWPPRDRFQPNFGSANKIFLGRLELFIPSICPNHRRLVPRMIWIIFLDDLGSPKIRCWISSLVIRFFHEKCPIYRRHLWSNTWSLCKSPERNGHISHPYRRVALYTRPLVASETSVQRHKWPMRHRASPPYGLTIWLFRLTLLNLCN